MPVLLKITKNYADEFDVYGFEVISDKKWAKYQEMFKCLEFPIEMSFGGNDVITFENIEGITRAVKVIELSILQEKFSHWNKTAPSRDS